MIPPVARADIEYHSWIVDMEDVRFVDPPTKFNPRRDWAIGALFDRIQGLVPVTQWFQMSMKNAMMKRTYVLFLPGQGKYD